ncbi:MAG TPA: heparan-alpha-glucosaminide N-acetyltransferase [Casimicrobiaceae bacterium]|nr:heparan-alpha-glucosaminide N-acetyltransferase [Casimicrobiaceae bacterium]
MAVRASLKRAAPRAAPPARVAAVDALRGIAILAMIAYHFSFDLRLFRLARLDFEHDPFWLAARAVIVATFMALVGASLVLARAQHATTSRRWRRVAVIVACALAVSVASRLAFPATWIWFGILHAIAVASVLAWPLAPHPRMALALGVGVIVAGLVVTHPAFDAPALAWIGFTTAKPATEDYVPLFPWLGATLVGIAAGHTLMRRDFAPLAAVARAPHALRWLGRHSLAIYMIHQPILIGALALALRRLP